MKILILFLFTIFLIAGSVQASLLPRESNGWTMNGPETVYTDNLHEHIDGAAPLYYELGCDSLIVASYQKRNAILEFNIYAMSGPESAMAIYLMQAGNEYPSDVFECRNSVNPYQVNLVKGNYFIQINITYDGKIELTEIKAILIPLIAQIHHTEISLLKELPSKNMIKGSERLARGKYSMRSIYFFGKDDPLLLDGKTFAVSGNYQTDNGLVTRILITYPDSAQAQKVFDQFTSSTPYLRILAHNNKQITFQDIRKKYGKIHINGRTLDIVTKMENLPQ